MGNRFRVALLFENGIDLAGRATEFAWRHTRHSAERTREVRLIAESEVGCNVTNGLIPR